MPTAKPERLHGQRHRAESFGAVAEDYDRFRPSYPDALIDDLVARHPSSALDIGCGTGKAARLLAARGVDVLGVEIDTDMAAMAQRSGIRVEIGSFESWEPGGRTFDLIVSGQAWHWIDPAIGVAKAAGVLGPDATLALFWNAVDIDEGVRAALRDAYTPIAPGVAPTGRDVRADDLPFADDLRASGLFGSVDVRKYAWQRVYSGAEYVRLVQTYSDHVVLPADQQRLLAEAMTDAIDRIGGVVTANYTTIAVIALARA